MTEENIVQAVLAAAVIAFVVILAVIWPSDGPR
jgi:hypothetical protein